MVANVEDPLGVVVGKEIELLVEVAVVVGVTREVG